MPIYTRKVTSVEARQHFGPNLNITSFKAGDQIARDGDFLVVDADAVAQQSSAGSSSVGKGCIYVIPKAQFLKDFNATDDTVVPVLKGDDEFNFATLVPAPAAPAAPAPSTKPAA